MSFFSRLLRKTRPGTTTPSTPEPAVPVASPPRPDPEEQRREEDARLSEAIARNDWSEVGRWALDGHSTQVRQRAAQAVTDPAQLSELIRATRHGKDKSVHRILVARRDAQLAEERREKQLQEDIEAAAAAIARHSERTVDATYEATLRQLESRWQSIAEHATPEARHTAADRLAHSRDALERHRLAAEVEAARQRAAALSVEEMRQQRERESLAAAEAAAEHERMVEAERQAVETRRQEAEANARRLIGLLRQAQAALDRGESARTMRLRAAIEETLPHAPELPPWFAARLQQLDARLADLKDWKTFTVAPKRAELLARMQALIGAEMSAEELAKHVRRLREEWRTLHRGAAVDPSPEWQLFEEAADRAYEPCRAHFAQQSEQRRQNQARREELIERLAIFAAEQEGESPNWRTIQQTLAEARREWREYAPVDQTAVKALQARFHAVVDDLQARLDAEYARNVQARRGIIERAAGLLALEDTRQAIEGAKELQREWRGAGPAPRHQDNALWEEFRRHCDAIFQRSAQESAAHGAVLQAGESRATELCEELERIAGLTGAELMHEAQRLRALREEFEALELPRASARGLRQRFTRADGRCSAALQLERAAAERQARMDVLAAAAEIQALALANWEGRAVDVTDASPQSVASSIARLAHAPKPARAALEEQLARLVAGEVGEDLAANAAALRLLCVRAELVAGLPSPEEDQELRRDYQMKRLVAAMGQGERAGPGDLEGLLLEWIGVGPVDPGFHAALRVRFEKCLAAGQ